MFHGFIHTEGDQVGSTLLCAYPFSMSPINAFPAPLFESDGAPVLAVVDNSCKFVVCRTLEIEIEKKTFVALLYC